MTELLKTLDFLLVPSSFVRDMKQLVKEKEKQAIKENSIYSPKLKSRAYGGAIIFEVLRLGAYAVLIDIINDMYIAYQMYQG